MVPSRVSIQVSDDNRAKLRNLQQRTAHNYACARRVETLPDGSGSGFRNLDRSSESLVFPKAPEAEPPPSTLGNRTGRIPLLSTPTNQERQTRKPTYSVAEQITTRERRTTMRLSSSNQNTSGHWSCRQSRKSTPKSNKPRSTTTDGTRTSLRPSTTIAGMKLE